LEEANEGIAVIPVLACSRAALQSHDERLD
jgi:hypothetical protein